MMEQDRIGTDTLPTWQANLPDRPLAGLTVLVVEDSRVASEAVRLLCLRSGARIRRADSIRAALRHLQTYRPCAVLIRSTTCGVTALPPLAKLAAKAQKDYGDAYCGGRIEASLRKVLNAQT